MLTPAPREFRASWRVVAPLVLTCWVIAAGALAVEVTGRTTGGHRLEWMLMIIVLTVVPSLLARRTKIVLDTGSLTMCGLLGCRTVERSRITRVVRLPGGLYIFGEGNRRLVRSHGILWSRSQLEDLGAELGVTVENN